MLTPVLLALINLVTVHRYYCDCGYRTNSQAKFTTHIAWHPGRLEIERTDTGHHMVEVA